MSLDDVFRQILALLKGHERGGIGHAFGLLILAGIVAAAIAIPLAFDEENEVVTLDATGVSTSSATLNGELPDWETPEPTEVYFAWGSSSGSYPNETPRQPYARTFSAEITDLSPGTTYYFVAKASSGSLTKQGSQKGFLTPPYADVTVQTLDATRLSGSSATLNGELLYLAGRPSVNAYFVWGTSPGSYPNRTALHTMTAARAFSQEISGLTPGTTYYFVARAGETAEGAEKSFYLPRASDGAVETLDADFPATSTMAVLNGNLTDLGGNASVEVYFLWGESPGAYIHETPHETMTAPGQFDAMITGPFDIGCTYYFVARAGAGQGGDKSFTVV